jgi:hypothetical protein
MFFPIFRNASGSEHLDVHPRQFILADHNSVRRSIPRSWAVLQLCLHRPAQGLVREGYQLFMLVNFEALLFRVA